MIFNHKIDQNEFVLFAELNRDHFDEILQSLTEQFEDIQSGRQGDDWIWIHLDDDKIEIDSFYSINNLDIKGKYKHYSVAKQVLQNIKKDWIIKIFDPPKPDPTR